MTYYEKLVKKIDRSMKQHPRNAMVMDMSTFQIIAQGSSLAMVKKKLEGMRSQNVLIFGNPNRKPSWIL